MIESIVCVMNAISWLRNKIFSVPLVLHFNWLNISFSHHHFYELFFIFGNTIISKKCPHCILFENNHVIYFHPKVIEQLVFKQLIFPCWYEKFIPFGNQCCLPQHLVDFDFKIYLVFHATCRKNIKLTVIGWIFFWN